MDVCKLLFIGSDWYRKGGDIAVEIAGSLNAMGLKTELTMLGGHMAGDCPGFCVDQRIRIQEIQRRAEL